MSEIKDKVEFPRHVTIGDTSYPNVWVGFQDGKAFLYHYSGRLIECLVDGIPVESVTSGTDSSLSESKVRANQRLRKSTSETVVLLDDGTEFVSRVRGGCGCSNPLKRAKNLGQVKQVQGKKQAEADSRDQRAAKRVGR